MGAIVFWITGVSIVYSIYCSGADQSKHQSSALLAFVRGFHRWPVNSPHKGPVTRKRFPFDDVIMHTPRELCMQFAPWCVLLLFGTRQLYVYPSVLLHWYKGHYSIPHSWLLGPDEQESPESIRNNDMASTKQTIIKQQYAFMLWNISYMMTSWNGNIFSVTGHLCGNSPAPGEFPAQRPVTRGFDVFFDLRVNKWLSKQSWGWWFDTPSDAAEYQNIDFPECVIMVPLDIC